MDHRDRRNYLLTAALLIVLGGLCLLRGPIRALQGGTDLVHLYAAATLLIEGANPYDGAQCVDRMQEAGYENPDHVREGSLYPPPTLAGLSPLGLLSWEAARLAWLVINLLACAGLAWSVAHWLKVSDPKLRWMLAVLLLVAWGPVATTLSLGQLSLVAAASLCAAVVLLERRRSWLAGLLIGWACVVKPQLGLGFVVLVLLMRNWRAAGVSVGVLALFSAAGIAWLQQSAAGWQDAFKQNLETGQAVGGIMDAAVGGPLRHQMIDLRPLLHIVLPTSAVGVAALVLVTLLAVAAIVRLLKLGLREHLLLATSGVSLLVLMPLYHRYYDAVLMMPLLALVANELIKGRRDKPLVIVALSLLPIFFPAPALLVRLQQKGVVPDSLANAWLWEHVVLQYQSWCMLSAALALVWWTYRLPLPSEPAPSTAESAA